MALEVGRVNVSVMMATPLNHAMNVMKDFTKIPTTVLKLAVSVSSNYVLACLSSLSTMRQRVFHNVAHFHVFIPECHESCDGGCHEGSPKGCESCKDGWEESEEEGCTDKDECTGDVCDANKYCVNTPGSFKCEG